VDISDGVDSNVFRQRGIPSTPILEKFTLKRKFHDVLPMALLASLLDRAKFFQMFVSVGLLKPAIAMGITDF
jgi:hypothetical protein